MRSMTFIPFPPDGHAMLQICSLFNLFQMMGFSSSRLNVRTAQHTKRAIVAPDFLTRNPDGDGERVRA